MTKFLPVSALKDKQLSDILYNDRSTQLPGNNSLALSPGLPLPSPIIMREEKKKKKNKGEEGLVKLIMRLTSRVERG